MRTKESTPQLTTLPTNILNFNDITNRISADGSKALFTTGEAGVNKVYTINTDGTGQTLVDPAGTTDVDISANGGVVLETIGYSGYGGTDFRVVGGNGSNPHLALHVVQGGYIGARLSADGQ